MFRHQRKVNTTKPNTIYRDAIEAHALDEMCGGKAKFIVVKPKHAKRFFNNLATLVAMYEKQLKAKGYTIMDRPIAIAAIAAAR